MSYELLRRAEKELRPLHEEVQMKGICWGPEIKNNRNAGRNLVFLRGNDVVILSQAGKRLKMRQFALTRNTKLGRRVRGILSGTAAASEGEEAPVYIAYCVLCDWRQQFDAGLAGEVDSRGAGSRELIQRMLEAHNKAHPGCDPSNVEVLNPQMVELGRLDRFLA